jgi:hypothetical protein
MDRILNMVVRRYAWRFIGKGIETGMERMSRGGSADGRPADLTPEQRAHVAKGQRTVRQAMQVARRFGRF